MEKKLLPLAHKHAHRGGGSEPVWVRPWRWAKTAFFLAAMLASLLLVCAPPLLVVILDLALFSATLRANDTAYGGSFASAALAQARAFGFWSSLADLPAVSAARAALILCRKASSYCCRWRSPPLKWPWRTRPAAANAAAACLQNRC